uniref:Uncharacterized protein n=1 Tax=Parascaris univalens TaxID=6257 RepID=A0A915ASN5_PARUN
MAGFNSGNNITSGGGCGGCGWNGPFNASPNTFGGSRNPRINSSNMPRWSSNANPNPYSSFNSCPNFSFSLNNNSSNPNLNNFNNAVSALNNNFNNMVNAVNTMNAINSAQRMNLADAFNRMSTVRSPNEMDRIVMEMNMNTQRALNAFNDLNRNLASNILYVNPTFNGLPNCQWKTTFNNDVNYSMHNTGDCCKDECCNSFCNNCWNCVSCNNCPGPMNGSFTVSQSGFSSGNPPQNWSRTTYTVRLPNGQIYQRTIDN